jgi:protein TonB
MKRQRLVIGAILFAIGTAVYLTFSGAPLRVHLVTLPMELALTIVVSYFFSATAMARSARLFGTFAGLTLVSIVETWLSSKVIAALAPLDMWYFVMGLGTTFLKGMLLLAVMWLIDYAIDVLGRRRGRHSLVVAVVPLMLIAAGRCVTVAAVVVEPQVISRGELTYPPELRQRAAEALVKLQMMVGADGVPRDIRVVRDDPNVSAVDAAVEKFAIDSVKTWRFKPATANGKPIERRYVTAIHWKAED